ncbi:hypothetical protein HYS31_05175 [Candidatus Woesearchaeota archaeon]|nr:hypothetical protein [Candidatus Woesearchaeota archaeon]
MLLKKRKHEKEENPDDSSIYSKEIREAMLEDDELSPFEEAFMDGYESA